MSKKSQSNRRGIILLGAALVVLLLLLLLRFGCSRKQVEAPAEAGVSPTVVAPVAARGVEVPAVRFELPPMKERPRVVEAPVEEAPKPVKVTPKKAAAATTAPVVTPRPKRDAAPRPVAPVIRRISADNEYFIVKKKGAIGGYLYVKSGSSETMEVPAKYYLQCRGTKDMLDYYFEVGAEDYRSVQLDLFYHVNKTSGWKAVERVPEPPAVPAGWVRVR